MLENLFDSKQLHSTCKALSKVKAQTVDAACGKAFKKPYDVLFEQVLALDQLLALYSEKELTTQGYNVALIKYIHRRYHQIFFNKYFARHKN